jgi:hypothetical protein
MEQEIKTCSCCGQEKPLSEYNKNAWGYKTICRECEKKHRAEKKEERKALKQQAIDAVNARNLRLQDFTPRELMLRLKELGYEGTLKYVRTEVIDISKL